MSVNEQSTIFITGASGFIGQAVFRELRARKLGVLPVKRLPDGAFDFEGRNTEGHVCVHLAGDNNAHSVASAAEAASRLAFAYADSLFAAKFERILYVSSGAVYGDASKEPHRETEAVTPVTQYGKMKRALEQRFLEGANNVVVRPGNVYGPGMSPANLLSEVLRQGASKPRVELGSLKAIRDYVHIGDVSRGLALLTEPGVKAGIYNIGTGRGSSVLQIARMLLEVSGKGQLEVVSRNAQESFSCMILDSSKLRAETGWKPEVSIEEGVQRLIEGGNA